jgi:hypothetical protein
LKFLSASEDEFNPEEIAKAMCDNWKRTKGYLDTLVRYNLVEPTRKVGRIRQYKINDTGRQYNAIVNHPYVRRLFEVNNEEDVIVENCDSVASQIYYQSAKLLE